MSDYQEMVEFRCRRYNCNKLLLNYYITGVGSNLYPPDGNLHLEGIDVADFMSCHQTALMSCL